MYPALRLGFIGKRSLSVKGSEVVRQFGVYSIVR